MSKVAYHILLIGISSFLAPPTPDLLISGWLEQLISKNHVGPLMKSSLVSMMSEDAHRAPFDSLSVCLEQIGWLKLSRLSAN